MRGREHSLVYQSGKFGRVVVLLAPVYLAAFHSHCVVEAQRRMLRLHFGAEHLRHPINVLAEDLPGTHHVHLTHQVHGEGLELLHEVVAARFHGGGKVCTVALLLQSLNRRHRRSCTSFRRL